MQIAKLLESNLSLLFQCSETN